MNPLYPIYVISKGRWESRLTVRALETLGAPYHVVVEPQEVAKYALYVDPAKIYTLPFSNLGLGSIPARNWVWEHALSLGAKRHWILDDNIDGFVRLNRNLYYPVATPTIFRILEDFVDRYANVGISGMNYRWLAPRKAKIPPFYRNARIYSCILIQNNIPYRWRGRYNEDTDLSLRALKDGWCTVLFNNFLANKATTMVMKGGNTDELYTGDGRLRMAQSLVEQHPDVTRITWKWGRWQHQVDYRAFRKNKFILRPDAQLLDGVNEYGLTLEDIPERERKVRFSSARVTLPPVEPPQLVNPITVDELRQAMSPAIVRNAASNLDELPTQLPDQFVAIDVETNGLGPGSLPVGLVVTTAIWSRYFPFGHLSGSAQHEASAVRCWATDMLRGKNLIFRAAKADIEWLRRWGLNLEALNVKPHEVQHQAALLDEHRRQFDLNTLSLDRLGIGKVELPPGPEIHERSADEIAPYARRDGRLTFDLYQSYTPDIEREDLTRVLELEDAIIYAVMEMERNGHPLDLEKLDRWCPEVEDARVKRLLLIHQLTGLQVNPDSGRDMKRLFARLGLTVPIAFDKKTRTFKESFVEELILPLAGHWADEYRREWVVDRPALQAAIEAKQLASWLSKYGEKYKKWTSEDGVLRYQLHQLRVDEGGTIIGRFSSSKVNIQQVTKPSKQAPVTRPWIVRELFVAPPERLFLSADASQIEFRLMAHYADARHIIEAYARDPNTDFHQIVTDDILGGIMTRDSAKNFNFMKVYGGGVGKAQEMTGWDEETARERMNEYDRRFPEARAVLNRASSLAERRGYVRTALGRRRRYRKGDRFYTALQAVLAGTAADVMKIKIRDLHRERKTLDLTPRSTVHDEYLGDVSPDPKAARLTQELLNEQSLPFKVPLTWEAKVGSNWKELKRWS